MNSFGLGLVLNFVDNATAGMGNATRAFQQMSITADAVSSSVSTSISDIVTASYALDQVGTTLMNTGSSIISLYGNVTQSVIDSGMQMQGYRMQLSALYGGVEQGEAKIQEIKDYAMKSVFEIESLIPAVTTMKAVGIEAMNEITTSSGQNTQKLLDYASDLAAMMPNLRNVYGTGVSAAMGAFKEYIAEGNALSLKRGAGLDITAILGEDKGKTIEERTQQVADLIEQLNIVGYTQKLNQTPTQRLSNLQDALFNSLTKIADSGVFDSYCDMLARLSDWVFSLVDNEETFNVITGVVADTITTLLTPLSNLLDLLIENGDALVNWIKENPKLAKNILVTVAAIGGLLVAGGALLKFISALGMASAGLSFVKRIPSLLSTIGWGFGKLLLKAAPLLAFAGLLYYAWKENLFGIRDVITKNFEYLSNVFKVIKDAWDGTLSMENYNLAESMGILPLIEAILQAKYYWDFFVEGFKTGFDGFFKSLEEFAGMLGFDISDTIVKIGEFLKSLFDIGQEDKWTDIGEKVGKIAGIVLSILAVVKVLSLFKPLLNLFGGKGLIGGIIGGGGGGAAATGSLKNLGITLLGLAGVLLVAVLVSKIPFSVPRVLQLVVVIGVIGILGTILTKISSKVGTIPVSTVAKGLANIAIIMGGMTALLAVIGLVSKIPFSVPRVVQLIALIGVIGVLGIAFSAISALIGLIPVAKVALGLANIAIIMGGLSALLAIVGLVSMIPFEIPRVVQLIAIITVLGVLGTALTIVSALIGLIPVASVALGLANIAIIMGGLTAVLTIIALVSKIPFSIPRVIQLIAVMTVIGLLGSVLSAISALVGFIPVALVALGLANIAIIMAGLSAVLAIIGLVSMIPFDIPRVIQIIALIGVIGLLGAALSAVAALIGLIPVALVALGLANIAIVMVGLSATLAAMSFITSGADVERVLGVVAVITVLGVLGAVLSAIAAVIGLIPFPIVLAGIANICLVVGALTGLAVLISEALPTIGENISEFATSLKPAFDAFKTLQGLDMEGIGAFFDSFGSFMLKVTGDKFASFFTGGSGLEKAAEGLVDFATTSKGAFDIFAQINIASFNNLMSAIDAIGEIGNKNIPSAYEGMYQSIQTSVNNSLTLLNSFASKGSTIGSSLMNSIASGITARTYAVRSALQSALSGISVTASPKVTLNLTPTVNTSGMVGLATGGYVKETGVAVLHPDEVVVNDDTTRKLNEFLNQQQASSSSSYNSSRGETHNDYSVTFSAGSVVIQLSNASDSELEKAAEKLMKIIERKQQLKAMAVRA